MNTAHDIRVKVLAELRGCTNFPKMLEPLRNLRPGFLLRVHEYLAPTYKNRSPGRIDAPGFTRPWLKVKPNFRRSTPEEIIIFDSLFSCMYSAVELSCYLGSCCCVCVCVCGVVGGSDTLLHIGRRLLVAWLYCRCRVWVCHHNAASSSL